MDVNDLRLIYIYGAEIGTDHHLVLMMLKEKDAYQEIRKKRTKWLTILLPMASSSPISLASIQDTQCKLYSFTV